MKRRGRNFVRWKFVYAEFHAQVMFLKGIFKLNFENCLIDRNLDCNYIFPNHSEKCIENRTQFHSCVGNSCTCWNFVNTSEISVYLLHVEKSITECC